MSPRTSRKRAAPPVDARPGKRRRAGTHQKTSVFDEVDARGSKTATLEQTRGYLAGLDDSSSVSHDSDDDHDFEDVPGIKPADRPNDEDNDDEEEAMDWEDVNGTAQNQAGSHERHQSVDGIADVTVTLNDDIKYGTATDRAASTVKKGPSKRERQVRNGTHCLHVQSLMWHNAVRNAWLNDDKLHQILLKGVPDGIRLEIDKWRANMGMPKVETSSNKDSTNAARLKRIAAKNKSKRGGRDWDVQAERQEKGRVNLSHGDPTLKLLKVLTAYWRKRFAVSAPGLRKVGYMPLKRLTQEINAWKKDKTGDARGERIEGIEHLRELAKNCRGSRDVGSQLFTALLRALGLEARMVANLQPAGIGWGKSEEARPPKSKKEVEEVIELDNSTDDTKVDPGSKQASWRDKTPARPLESTRKKGTNAVVILDTESESNLSSPPSDFDDDTSVIDMTDKMAPVRPNRKFDRDMHYPNYWTEVLSPVSNTYIPVDPIVLSTVATNGELLASFEPRGKRADQAKQVICYTIAHSADGTAKEVTVRYLRKHQLPGRTKGFRMPVEKIKIHDRKGRVKRYEDYDWFKTVMSLFERPHHLRTVADDLEDTTDLKSAVPDAEKPKVETESLQWYKQSAEFVLERHLRREEAIPPSAKPVKSFVTGKGDKEVSEPVYLRKEVIECKTAESWHKVGREIRIGEQPMKLVPMRAVTTMRKREMEDIERETGEKAKQGLFAKRQTDWIIPEPIGEDRKIPKNAFGNIDVYVPSMVPKGAVHVPYKGTARVCKDLNVSFAEAVTGFEFGKRMAIPIITGVVIAEENQEAVLKLWVEREAVKREREAAKKSQACLALWRKLFTGLRIMERMKREYEGTGREEDINPFVRKAQIVTVQTNGYDKDLGMAGVEGEEAEEGGFLRDDYSVGNAAPSSLRRQALREEDIDIEVGGGGFLPEQVGVDDHDEEADPFNSAAHPVSLRAAKEELRNFRYDGDSDRSLLSQAQPHLGDRTGDEGKRDNSSVLSDGASAHSSRKPATKVKRGRKSYGGAARAPASGKSTQRSKANMAKAGTTTSPTKSQYFTKTNGGRRGVERMGNAPRTEAQSEQNETWEASGEEEDAAVEEDSDDGHTSGEEVVTPRATTARTRTRASRRG